jgi:hypothetical protein
MVVVVEAGLRRSSRMRQDIYDREAGEHSEQRIVAVLPVLAGVACQAAPEHLHPDAT